MPLIVGSLLASMAVLWFIHSKNELLYNCENGLLTSQHILVTQENQLLQLNRPIESLVLKKKILKKALLVARTPVELSLIKAQLLQIELQLKALQQKQMMLIQHANLLAQQQNQKVVWQIKKRLNDFQKQWATHLIALVKITPAVIQLSKKIIDASAVIYTEPPRFQHKQTLQLHWRLSGQSLFPSWLLFLREQNFSWQDSCSTRPFKKKEGLWTAEIGAAASLSKL